DGGDRSGDVQEAAGRGARGGQRRTAAARGGEGRGGARAGNREAELDQAIQEVQGRGVRAEQGGGRAAHAILQGVPAAVLFPDDGCDGSGGIAGRHGDGDAWGQCGADGGVDYAGGHGQGAALCDSRRRTQGGGRHGYGNF